LRNNVSVMDNAVRVLEHFHRKVSVVLTADSRLSEVSHRSLDSLLDQMHGSKVSLRSTETVSSSLNSCIGEQELKCLNFLQDVSDDSVNCFLVASVNLAIALGPGSVVFLETV